MQFLFFNMGFTLVFDESRTSFEVLTGSDMMLKLTSDVSSQLKDLLVYFLREQEARMLSSALFNNCPYSAELDQMIGETEFRYDRIQRRLKITRWDYDGVASLDSDDIKEVITTLLRAEAEVQVNSFRISFSWFSEIEVSSL